MENIKDIIKSSESYLSKLFDCNFKYDSEDSKLTKPGKQYCFGYNNLKWHNKGIQVHFPYPNTTRIKFMSENICGFWFDYDLEIDLKVLNSFIKKECKTLGKFIFEQYSDRPTGLRSSASIYYGK